MSLRESLREHRDLLPVIAVGGALGSLARWGVGKALPHAASEFAWSTFLINLSGALLIGLLMAAMLSVWSHTRYIRPFLGPGVLGGYTTFSGYLVDTRGVLAAGHAGIALLYLFGTLLAGLAAVLAGLFAGRLALRQRPLWRKAGA